MAAPDDGDGVEPAYAGGAMLETRLAGEIASWTSFIDAHGIRPE